MMTCAVFISWGPRYHPVTWSWMIHQEIYIYIYARLSFLVCLLFYNKNKKRHCDVMWCDIGLHTVVSEWNVAQWSILLWLPVFIHCFLDPAGCWRPPIVRGDTTLTPWAWRLPWHISSLCTLWFFGGVQGGWWLHFKDIKLHGLFLCVTVLILITFLSNSLQENLLLTF